MSSPTSLAVPRSLRLLLLQAQSPFDPTSGAAQSMRQIAELVAAQGATVKSLTTSLCEGPVTESPPELMQAAGAEVTVLPRTGRIPLRWRARHGGVEHEIMHVDPTKRHSWEHLIGREYNHRLAALTRTFAPEVVLTFGGDPTDILRRQALRASGARVIFALHNFYYLDRRPEEVDTFLAPTHYLAARYTAAWQIPIEVLPPPIDPNRCVNASPEPICIGFFNPEPAKGAALVAHLADRLARERPDLPLLVIGGRAPASNLVTLGERLGIKLNGLPNLLQAAPTAQVADLLGACRVMLVPSIVEEAAGRITIEAMANGAVPLVSDRGGLPEMVGAAGIVLPLCPSLTLANPCDVRAETIETWWQALQQIIDDEPAWQHQSALARQHAATFFPDALGPRYAAWFSTQAKPR